MYTSPEGREGRCIVQETPTTQGTEKKRKNPSGTFPLGQFLSQFNEVPFV